jgi:hypothetical protein
MYNVSSSANGISLTLPTLEHINQSGKRIVLKKVSSDSNDIKILVPVSHKIDGVTDSSLTLNSLNEYYELIADYENLDYKIIGKSSSDSLKSVILNTSGDKTLALNTIYEISSNSVAGSNLTLPSGNKENDQVIIVISCSGFNYLGGTYFSILGNINGVANNIIIGNANYKTISFRWSNSTWIYE